MSDSYLGPYLELTQSYSARVGWCGRRLTRGPAVFLRERLLLTTRLATCSSGIGELESALAATAAEFIADERNYANVPSVPQIGEMLE